MEDDLINEYIYYISKEEKYKLEELKESITINQDYKLALISCYQSLYSINNKFIDLDNYKSNNKDLIQLIDLQYRDIIIEGNISNKIIMSDRFNTLKHSITPYKRYWDCRRTSSI